MLHDESPVPTGSRFTVLEQYPWKLEIGFRFANRLLHAVYSAVTSRVALKPCSSFYVTIDFALISDHLE